MNIQKELFSMQDKAYKDFQSKLMPTVPYECIIGVRTPLLRSLARNIAKNGEATSFLNTLPHKYFEENNLHAFLICEMRDFDACIHALELFLPYIDNWATCDQLSPKVLKKNLDALELYALNWINSKHTYTVRFGIGMLMRYFLDERFSDKYPSAVAAIRSDEYYIKMMQSWYFATALAKQYDSVIAYLQENRLDKWTHNKTIQKAIESYRITDEQKAFLRKLKR